MQSSLIGETHEQHRRNQDYIGLVVGRIPVVSVDHKLYAVDKKEEP